MTHADDKISAQRALQAAKERAGGGANLARRIGISGAAVSRWRRIPLKRLAAVAHATGMSLIELRPDIYWPPEEKETRDGTTQETA